MLLARESLPAVAAVERLAGMQAQEPRHPFTGLWTRLEGFGAAELRDALADSRRVVRGTSLRGTLHLHSAADYARWRPLLQPVLSAGMGVLGERAAGLDVDAVIAQARALLEQEPRTFAQLRTLLSAAFPDVDERALGFAVRMHVPLVMLPTDDRWGFPSVARFTLADAWLGDAWATEEPDDAALEGLVRRYLAAFGPASVADLQAWSFLKELKPVVERMRDELLVFKPEGGRRELFDLPDAPRPGADADAPVRFLPEFDNLLLSHADRARVLAEEHRRAVFTKNLRVRATFLVDGMVAGTWTVERRRGTATLALAPIRGLRKRDLRALEEEGEALARFVEPDAKDHAVQVAQPA